MKIVIIIVALLIALTIIAFLYRRKFLSQIQMLEQEKLQIQHKPIFEEMMKIKQLNMTGETEEKFERWRKEWTEVVDIQMPVIDDLFFDAEDYIDRFRYGKAKETEKRILEKIEESTEKMNSILNELHELVGSEEKNRTEIEFIKEQHREARKKVLAHQHSYGAAAEMLEKELESFKEQFIVYEELTENGNYLQAREIVISLQQDGGRIFSLIEQIPLLLQELQNNIPIAIRELSNGSREMEEHSYYLAHLELPKHLATMEKAVEECIKKIGKLEMEGITEQTEAMNDQLDSFYNALEEEVHAKQFVDTNVEEIQEKLLKATVFSHELSSETMLVQRSYRLNEEEASIPEEYMRDLKELSKQFEVFSTRLTDKTSAYSALDEELHVIQKTLEEIMKNQNEFKNHLKNLRNDEMDVRKKVENLSRKLQKVDRLLHRGNIPGIPDEMDARLEEAEEQVYVVTQSLQEIPLNMSLVHSYLENAQKAVVDVSEKVDELLENVMLIERIIQYGNRYRASNQEVHQGLLEAEESFRQFRYAKALEEAATVVEAVEPGAMKRIEDIMGAEQKEEVPVES